MTSRRPTSARAATITTYMTRSRAVMNDSAERAAAIT